VVCDSTPVQTTALRGLLLGIAKPLCLNALIFTGFLQMQQRLVNGAAKKVADEFFQKFAATVAPQGAPAPTA